MIRVRIHPHCEAPPINFSTEPDNRRKPACCCPHESDACRLQRYDAVHHPRVCTLTPVQALDLVLMTGLPFSWRFADSKTSPQSKDKLTRILQRNSKRSSQILLMNGLNLTRCVCCHANPIAAHKNLQTRLHQHRHAVLDTWMKAYEHAQGDVSKLKHQYLSKVRKADEAEDEYVCNTGASALFNIVPSQCQICTQL